MARLIDADALIAWCRTQADDPWNCGVAPVSWGAAFEEFIDSVGDITTVDAVEVVHGRWIDKRGIPSYSAKNIPVVECSKCRCVFCDIINVHSFMYHYCPNCGAKMDGERRTDNA